MKAKIYFDVLGNNQLQNQNIEINLKDENGKFRVKRGLRLFNEIMKKLKSEYGNSSVVLRNITITPCDEGDAKRIQRVIKTLGKDVEHTNTSITMPPLVTTTNIVLRILTNHKPLIYPIREAVRSMYKRLGREENTVEEPQNIKDIKKRIKNTLSSQEISQRLKKLNLLFASNNEITRWIRYKRFEMLQFLTKDKIAELIRTVMSIPTVFSNKDEVRNKISKLKEILAGVYDVDVAGLLLDRVDRVADEIKLDIKAVGEGVGFENMVGLYMACQYKEYSGVLITTDDKYKDILKDAVWEVDVKKGLGGFVRELTSLEAGFVEDGNIITYKTAEVLMNKNPEVAKPITTLLTFTIAKKKLINGDSLDRWFVFNPVVMHAINRIQKRLTEKVQKLALKKKKPKEIRQFDVRKQINKMLKGIIRTTKVDI